MPEAVLAGLKIIAATKAFDWTVHAEGDEIPADV